MSQCVQSVIYSVGPRDRPQPRLVGLRVIVFTNIETIRTNEGAEITTSAALLVTTFAGLLAGQGHTFTPTALGVATAAFLARFDLAAKSEKQERGEPKKRHSLHNNSSRLPISTTASCEVNNDELR